MDANQISTIMRDQATSLNKTSNLVTDDTVLNTVLSDTDGFGIATSKNLFKGAIQWTFVKNNHVNPRRRWPNTWLDMSIRDLAQKLVILALILTSTSAFSQLTVDLNTVKTENKVNAVAVGITYAKALDSLFKVQDIFDARNHSLFAVSPEINVHTGTSDAFSSITAKATGMFMFFKTKTIDGLLTPNLSRPFTVVPLSVGFETNNKFTSLNTIVEAGWIPWYQVGSTPGWLKQTKLGFFLQSGYKSAWDSAAALIGGQKDESKETPNSFLLRLKGSQAVNISTPVNIGTVPVTLVGSADEWYDIAHKAFYYQYNLRTRFSISADQQIDLIYQKGSGAPNFNQGDQYGIGLSIQF